MRIREHIDVFSTFARDTVTFTVSLIVLLVAGDCTSTMLYHIPQHIWGKLHLRTHHDNTRSYWDHSIISKNPAVLLDGFLGALPYLVIAAILTRFGSAATWAAVAGLVLGQLHVMWRHTCELGWSSSPRFARVAHALGLVLPEDHNGHHKNPDVEFGDLFRIYDAPARAMLAYFRYGMQRRRRLQRLRASRSLRRMYCDGQPR
jgi:hypothetical protein